MPTSPTRRNPSACFAGFSLIELLIAMAVVGLLASIAYPSYVSHVERTHRATARAALLDASHYMERYYAAKGSYAGASLPVQLSTVPAGVASTEARYALSVASSSPIGYALEARPLRSDPCGTLGLNEQGVQTAASASSGPGASVTVASCWR